MSKYKVGDKVKVREDLVGGKIYEGQSAVSDMVEFKGKEVTIERTSCSGNDEYRIKELGYTWTNEMFEGLVDEEVKSDFKVGSKIEVISIDDIDEERNIKIGDTANIISSKENDSFSKEYNCVFVKFINDDRIIKREIDDYDTEGCMLFTNQIKLVEDFIEEPSPIPKSHFTTKPKQVNPKYVKCIDNIDDNDNGLVLNKIYEVEYSFPVGYRLIGINDYVFFKYRFVEVDSPIEPNTSIEPTQSIPNKGTIKYRITDDGIAYATLNGSKTGKSVKSNKDESRNEIGILISVCRMLNIDENKISGIVDVLFDDDSYNSKAKCDNAIMKNDIARALSILDKYKE